MSSRKVSALTIMKALREHKVAPTRVCQNVGDLDCRVELGEGGYRSGAGVGEETGGMSHEEEDEDLDKGRSSSQLLPTISHLV
jgi:hypothetical protein